MRLTRLELIGFKSFAKKTELSFGEGITAVIGPNGSGKSNIADAIRWVLGEQNARLLRGTRMEDVIFSGTQQRNSLGYCEVALYFDNADGKLAVDYSEVEVSRRLYRSGESEYRINRNSCRLKDVQELFRDTGIGRDGYSIISQGKVDEILSNKSNDRRTALEEAAGIMHYRVKKEEAERKLDHTEKNLTRLRDIVSELSNRIGPLESQSAKARSYLNLRDELKDLEVNQFLYQYNRTNDKKADFERLTEEIHQREESFEEEAGKLLADLDKLESEHTVLGGKIDSQNRLILEATTNFENSKGESRVLSERKNHILSEISRIDSDLEGCNFRKEKIKEEINVLNTNPEKTEMIRYLDDQIKESESVIASKDEELKAFETELDQLKTELMDHMNSIADAKSDFSRYDAMQISINDRQRFLHEEEKETALADESLRSELRNEQRKLDSIQEKKNELCVLLDSSKKTLESFEGEYQEKNLELRSLEQEIGRAESRKHILDDMVLAHEGYSNPVKNLLSDADHDRELKKRIVGVVAELIHVPEQYELAVNMALGGALQFIVTFDAEGAQYCVDYLRNKNYGRATFLPVSLLKQKNLTDQEVACLKSPGCIGLASELVSYDETMSDVVRYLLGRTLLVRDFHSGIMIKKNRSGSLQIATLEGDIISTGGAITGGSIRKNEVSLIGRKREIKELARFLEEKESKMVSLEKEIESMKTKILQSNVQIDAFSQELNETEILFTKQKDTCSIIGRDIEKNAERVAKIKEELSALEEDTAEIQQKRTNAETVRDQLMQKNDVTQEDVQKSQIRMNELRSQRDLFFTELSSRKVRLVELKKEQDLLDSDRRRLNDELQRLSVQMQSLTESRQELMLQIESVDKELSGFLNRTEEQMRIYEEQKTLLNSLILSRQKLSETIFQKRSRHDFVLSELRELGEKKHRLELNATRMEMELSVMQERIWEEYELTYENALKLKHDFAPGAASSRIKELRTQIRDLGDVNVGSIEEYRSVSERYNDMTAQISDLEKASDDLNKIISELISTMKKDFIDQFAIIQKYFSSVFQELFGGGYAELRLSDKEDVLGCDIDIIAQPPGKKLQLLSLLSGGERALTAIALVFSLLKLKPPAFCVLDEIESSLDEANVSRFAGYLKEYADETQFILITHRKGSMEVCDTLYGVSMEERGISKIVSAKFEEVSA